jgi:hypothetical protein
MAYKLANSSERIVAIGPDAVWDEWTVRDPPSEDLMPDNAQQGGKNQIGSNAEWSNTRLIARSADRNMTLYLPRESSRGNTFPGPDCEGREPRSDRR